MERTNSAALERLETPPVGDPALLHLPVCPACGGAARRRAARFCSTCGRNLIHGSYLPADSLRSSYHRQGLKDTASRPASGDQQPARGRAAARSAPVKLSVRLSPSRNGATVSIAAAIAVAHAFVIFSLVPYLGVFFCPGALLSGGIALMRARRFPQPPPGSVRASAISLLLAAGICTAQLFLWWLLYQVSGWT